MRTMRMAAMLVVVTGCGLGATEPSLLVLTGEADDNPFVIAGAREWRAAGFDYGGGTDVDGLAECAAADRVAACSPARCRQRIHVGMDGAERIPGAVGVWWHAGADAHLAIRDDLSPLEIEAAMAKGVGGILGLEMGGNGIMAPYVSPAQSVGDEDLAALAVLCD